MTTQKTERRSERPRSVFHCVGGAVWLAALLLSSPGCRSKSPTGPQTPALRRFNAGFPALGARFHISFFAANNSAATTALNAVSKRLADLESKLSTDRADSELSRLCAGAGGPPAKLSDDLFSVLELAQRVAKRSDGAFDVTAAPYLALWRRADVAGVEPAEEQLAVVRPLVGWTRLRLDPIERTAALETAGMRVDPMSVTVGYVADQILAELDRAGAGQASVRTDWGVFGRVQAFGAAPPGQAGWAPDLDTRRRPRRAGVPRFTLAHAAVASSPRGLLLDPLTGRAASNRPVVTVQARTAASAAALSTAAAVLGRERGESLVRSAGGAARFEQASPAAKPR